MANKEEESKKFDIKDMTMLLEDKTILSTPLEAQYDIYKFQKYNLVNPPSTSKRVSNTCTVKYYCQTYLYDENSKKFYICDKNYKNPKKEKLSNMSQDKKWLRYCLLLMQEEEQTLFEINKSTLEEFYQNQVDKFFDIKKKEKAKELKMIEREKILKEKEEKKKKGEVQVQEGEASSKNPPQPKQKKEIKIDMNIVNDVPKSYKLEEKLYYRIFIEDVFIEKPPFPDTVKGLESYVKAINAEIKKLIQKEEKKDKEKREYTLAESWCKEIINKIINMTKGKIKDEYYSDSFKSKRKLIEEEVKKALLNLMSIYSKKMESDSKYVYQIINLVEETYYKRYRGQFDEKFLKVTEYYVNCLIRISDFSKAKKIVQISKDKCSKLKDAETLLKTLESNIENAEKKKNNEKIAMSKGQIKAGLDDSKPDYDWQQGQNEEELNEALNRDVNHVKNNMDLINSSK
jgi:hypothetical protein